MSEALLWGPEADELVRQLEAQGVTLRLRGEKTDRAQSYSARLGPAWDK